MTNNSLRNNPKKIGLKRKKNTIVLEKKRRQSEYNIKYINSLKIDNEKRKKFNLKKNEKKKCQIVKHQKLEYYYNNLDIINKKRRNNYSETKKKNKIVSLVLEWDFDNPCER